MITGKQLKASRRSADYIDALEGKKRRPLWERIIIYLVILVSFLYIGVEGRAQIVHFRHMMLRQQLLEIRNGVIFYNLVYGALPPDLATLSKATMSDPHGKKPFPILDEIDEDKDGRLVDPLGYPYQYNGRDGSVQSTAPCCWQW